MLYATGGLAVGEVKVATTPSGVFQLFDGNSNVAIGAPFTVTGTTVSEVRRVW
ncbi:hypothetical protein [Bradyrhizobium sp. JYMT SZCCT0428]|uniref:hypothetical protein n=1 Tax=Bradyrhizobium sp. JYMT SZCCT0428 TaxID=2807673 RepID=UPI001BA92C73|nr:hypothetical protein [Bradyrhizobium sp. JYMT SZCCT0428]MBR1152662.1 hypothetical protein [Bradyrhizobium sp. JYMT SZCCT0428]